MNNEILFNILHILEVIWIPIGTKFSIHEYDGNESIYDDRDFNLVA